MEAGEKDAESSRCLLKGLGQEGSGVNTGATATARTWAGRSTTEHWTLHIGLSGQHSVYRMLLFFLRVTRLYSAEEDK